jgi:hypothetical protein
MWNVARDHTDAMLAIIFPTMVRLEKLDLILRFRYWQYFELMIRRAVAHEKPFDKQPLFMSLTDFMYVSSWDLPGVDEFYYRRFSGRPWILEPIGLYCSIM